MAQAGYTPISLYYSTTAAAQPTAGNLVAGELALNTVDEKLYFKNSAGTVKLLASSAGTTNVSSITFGSTGLTPSTATTGAVTVAGTLAVGNGGTGITSFGTGVAGALGQNVSGTGSIALTTSPVFTTPNLGTPSAGTLTSCTGLPLSTGITGTLGTSNGGTGSTSTTYCSLTSNVTGTLPVGNGGTGATTQTAYAVLCGGTTSTDAYQSIASVGTAGQILTSNGAGALPTFQAAGGGFASGTVMLFAQTAAPTGWTKNTTTGDNSALRIVTGTASTGGTVNFTTAFASQTPTGSVAISSVSGSAGATTLTTPQIPSHTHNFIWSNGNSQNPLQSNSSFGAADTAGQGLGRDPPYPTSSNVMNQPAGGGGSHTHPFSFSSGSGTFSGNAIDLAVKYVDVIRATKD
jgi:hypothetical protein